MPVRVRPLHALGARGMWAGRASSAPSLASSAPSQVQCDATFRDGGAGRSPRSPERLLPCGYGPALACAAAATRGVGPRSSAPSLASSAPSQVLLPGRSGGKHPRRRSGDLGGQPCLLVASPPGITRASLGRERATRSNRARNTSPSPRSSPRCQGVSDSQHQWSERCGG